MHSALVRDMLMWYGSMYAAGGTVGGPGVGGGPSQVPPTQVPFRQQSPFGSVAPGRFGGQYCPSTPHVQPWQLTALVTFCLHAVSSHDLQSQSLAAHLEFPVHENGFVSSGSP
jgi:hypothetical protein